MTVRLPEELEHSIRAEVLNGHFASADELVAQAVRSFLGQITPRVIDGGLGSIGSMRDAADELDQVVADAYRNRREQKWRDVDVE